MEGYSFPRLDAYDLETSFIIGFIIERSLEVSVATESVKGWYATYFSRICYLRIRLAQC